MAKILLAEQDKDLRLSLTEYWIKAQAESFNDGWSVVNGEISWHDVFILDQQVPTNDGALSIS